MGEAAAEQWPADQQTACISITEPIKPGGRAEPARLPRGFADVLRLEFQDIDPQRLHPEHAPPGHIESLVLFTPTMAARLARFARRHRSHGRNILVHCAAGVSRSGAVCEALLQAFPEYDDKGWPRHPNGHVLTILKRALGLVPLGYEEPRPVPREDGRIRWTGGDPANLPSNDPIVVEEDEQ